MSADKLSPRELAKRLEDHAATHEIIFGKQFRSEEERQAAAELRRLSASNDELIEALKNVTVHLVAAHSLLQRGGKKAAASDKIFNIMLADYEKSFEVGRAAITKHSAEVLDDAELVRAMAEAFEAVHGDAIDLRPVAAMLRRIPALEAERDTYRARLDRAIAAAEEHFGEDAIRYKLSLFKNGRARNIFPDSMDGRWVALQRADNDAHIGLSLRVAEAEAERDQLRAEIKALKDPSTEHVKHTFNGACPDLLDRHRRDPDCPACALLGAARKVAE